MCPRRRRAAGARAPSLEPAGPFANYDCLTMTTTRFTSPERRLIAGLTLVFFGSILDLMMFSIALPHIRIEYGLPADTASWLTIVFNMPYILLMPFYGRLGDLLGKRRVLITGAAVFAAGSITCLFAGTVPLLVAGRIVQGSGAAAISPLCLSIITEQIGQEKRGKAIGTWNSFGPIAGILGPLAAGLLIELVGWRSIFVPSALCVALSFPVMLKLLPKDDTATGAMRVFRSYDWAGFGFFAAGLFSIILYVSSRVVTGREPFTDWRLLIPACVSIVLFVLRERRTAVRFIDLSLLRKRNFTIASLCIGIRMFLLRGIDFLIPLFITEIYGFTATRTGVLIAVHSGFLLLTMRLGGIVADKLSNRYPALFGLLFQAVSFGMLAFVAGATNFAPLLVALAFSGSAAGLSIATLHHTALHGVAPKNAGAAAGLHSMIRFIGALFGAAVAGVALEQGMGIFPGSGMAYRTPFIVMASVGGVGFLLALFLKEIERVSPPDAHHQ